MSAPTTGWVALVRCPLCLGQHRILWPYPYTPTSRQKMEATCPERGRLLVLETAHVWAEWEGSVAEGEPQVLVATERYT